MASTNHYRINNPAAGRFNAPNGFWIIPDNATSVTFNFQTNGTTISNATLFNRNATAGTDASSLNVGSGVSSGNFISSLGHNGAAAFTVGFSFTAGAPLWIDIWISVYTGTAYPLLKVRRAGAWVNLSGDKILVRRAGAWVQVNELLVRRAGVWKGP